MAESARLGTSDDLPVLVALGTAHSASLPDKRGGSMLLADDSLEGPLEDHLDRALADDDDSILVVGTFDDVPFGFATVRLIRFDDSRTIARLDHFLVDPEAREVGVGEAVMNFAVEWATAQGCFGIESRALPGDRETKNFFESFGLKARLLTVQRSLADEA